MSGPAIEAVGLGKRYWVGNRPERYATLRDALRSLVRRREAFAPAGDLWALRDINLTIDAGEVLGVVGANGAGKTTLLKLVAGITEPTTGLVRTRGRVGSLLEVGTAFHPELTGRENIFLNGAVLGMRRREIARRFDEIVDFADVGRFLDVPLKRYSSGMQMRLGFAVAAHLDVEVVAVDEVLALGDAEFQRRCLTKLSELGGGGRTAMFVSHDLGAVTRLCGRAVWLDKGRIRAVGRPDDVVASYLKTSLDEGVTIDLGFDEGAPVRLTSVSLQSGTDGSGQLVRGDALDVSIRLNADDLASPADIAVYILNASGTCVLDEAFSDAERSPPLPGGATQSQLGLRIPPLLPAGDYVLGVWVGNEYETYFNREVARFSLLPRPDDLREAVRRTRVVQPPVQWRLNPVDDE